MSENLLQLIPEMPTYVPSKEAALLAEQFLISHILETGKVSAKVSNKIKFIDAGTNFENISCPVCGKKVSDDWWSAAIDDAYKLQFSNLDIVVPCCGSRTTLNHLNYNFPQGFARFVLTATNPGISKFDEQAKEELERILGCRLRVIWTHH